ncbi:hypothetical protein BDV32DRAFT_133436 [Aspergillus pseudonomiae]|nr:hypothetical protein BDV32DRAFT_133436 [Aspergillus pseudonomiae]
MADAAVTDWTELHQLMVERYPDLPYHEAYVELLRDAFIRFPNEVADIITPALPHLVERFPEAMEAFGTAIGSRSTVFLGQMLRIAKVRENTNHTLEKIALELKTFNNSNIFGQIANIGALITSSCCVLYQKNGGSSREYSRKPGADWGPYSL